MRQQEEEGRKEMKERGMSGDRRERDGAGQCGSGEMTARPHLLSLSLPFFSSSLSCGLTRSLTAPPAGGHA